MAYIPLMSMHAFVPSSSATVCRTRLGLKRKLQYLSHREPPNGLPAYSMFACLCILCADLAEHCSSDEQLRSGTAGNSAAISADMAFALASHIMPRK